MLSHDDKVARDGHLGGTRLAITVSVAVGMMVLVVLSLVLTTLFNKRARQAFLKSRKNPDERLKSLDEVSPTRTLGEWWSVTKGKMGLSEEVDNQFVCAVCLEQVERSEEIRELQCLHVFHRECLEKWFLGDHYNCPLCHRPYYVPDPNANLHKPRSDFIWIV